MRGLRGNPEPCTNPNPTSDPNPNPNPNPDPTLPLTRTRTRTRTRTLGNPEPCHLVYTWLVKELVLRRKAGGLAADAPIVSRIYQVMVG